MRTCLATACCASTSSTDGVPSNTFQTQICHGRKYLQGTYAARVHFSNEPASGPDGDQVVETFYTITPYEEPLKPEYSEMDFEYLPNGGWGLPPMTFAFTTWETVQIEPWNADNKSDQRFENTEGWHTLVVQAMDGTVRYFVDGKQVAVHTGNYYPDAPMSINFNLWFINDGLNGSSEARLLPGGDRLGLPQSGYCPDPQTGGAKGARAAPVRDPIHGYCTGRIACPGVPL